MTYDDAVRYAGFGRRIAAFALDFVVIAGYIILLAGVGVGITLAFGPLDSASPLFASPIVMDAIAFVTLVLPVILYFGLSESSAAQATWGKRKLGLRVADAACGRLSRPRALLRAAVKFLPWQIAHTSLFHVPGWPFAPVDPTPLVLAGFILAQGLVLVYVVFLAVGRAHRTPYDWVSGAYVVVSKGEATGGV